MTCQNHPEVEATAFCRACGKPLCNGCRRDTYDTVYCAEHAPAAAPPPRPSPVYSSASPGLALVLGFIPGVGAIYNGQYAKGLVHAVVFGVLVSIIDSNPYGAEPLFGILLATWIFYMAFEAYHTARRRRLGEAVDEYSSLLNLHGRPGNAPAAGIVLIILGILMLLHTLNLLNFAYIGRYWPILLIIAGAYLLYERIGAPGRRDEVTDERR